MSFEQWIASTWDILAGYLTSAQMRDAKLHDEDVMRDYFHDGCSPTLAVQSYLAY